MGDLLDKLPSIYKDKDKPSQLFMSLYFLLFSHDVVSNDNACNDNALLRYKVFSSSYYAPKNLPFSAFVPPIPVCLNPGFSGV